MTITTGHPASRLEPARGALAKCLRLGIAGPILTPFRLSTRVTGPDGAKLIVFAYTGRTDGSNTTWFSAAYPYPLSDEYCFCASIGGLPTWVVANFFNDAVSCQQVLTNLAT